VLQCLKHVITVNTRTAVCEITNTLTFVDKLHPNQDEVRAYSKKNIYIPHVFENKNV